MKVIINNVSIKKYVFKIDVSNYGTEYYLKLSQSKKSLCTQLWFDILPFNFEKENEMHLILFHD